MIGTNIAMKFCCSVDILHRLGHTNLILCLSGQKIFQKRPVGKLENDNNSHMIMILVTVSLLFIRVSPSTFDNLGFCFTFSILMSMLVIIYTNLLLHSK